jgi:MSHA biogenesis protein MshI
VRRATRAIIEVVRAGATPQSARKFSPGPAASSRQEEGSLLRWLRARPPAGGRVGIGLDPFGFGIAMARRAPDGAVEAEWEFVRCGPEDRAAELASEVARRGLRGAPCTIVLEPESYTLRSLDAPDVPEKELGEAVRWALRDQVDFDVAEAAVDAFEIPGQLERRGKRRVYAVVARPPPVRAAGALVTRSGLELAAIDVAELALRNLLGLHAADSNGVALVCLREDSGLISLTRSSRLYLTRWFPADSSLLADFPDKTPDAGAPDDGSGGAAEALLLEIQRSLDYYRHELAQRPPVRVALAPRALAHPALCAYLARNLEHPVEPLDPTTLVRSRSTDDAFAALLALGGAMREEAAA